MSDERREHVGRVIRKAIRTSASPREVWEAWADPRRIAQWFVDRAEGEARPGEVVTWFFEAMGFEMPVPIVAAEPERYLAIAGELPGRPPFLQEVEIEAEGGRTVLRLANSGFGDGAEWDEELEGVDSGWELALAQLRHWLEVHGLDGPPRGHLLALRPAEHEYADVQPFFETARGLERWLAGRAELSSEPLRTGDRARLELGAAGTLDGEVLARTRRELLLAWPERDAVLGLKCFGAGPGKRTIALDLSAWPLPDEDRPALEAWMQGALERLAAALAAR